MKKNFIAAALTITATAAILATSSSARGAIVIESPESMGCINMSWGNLEATKVIIADTATTVCFRMQYPTDRTFCFVSNSYLRDEVGNRYPLRSAVGIKLDDIISMPDSIFEFTMNFEPLPRNVQLFDFIEGDVDRAFKLLGIHDKKIEQNVPTFEQLSAAYPFTIPDDWLATDTITVRGRLEEYDAEKLGFPVLQSVVTDVFGGKGKTIVLNIADDGSFEKRFCASYPVCMDFWDRNSNNGVTMHFSFFARPGDTVDITLRPNKFGVYECFYNSGSSKDVERWLKSDLFEDLSYKMELFDGSFEDAKIEAEKLWRNMTLRLAIIGRSCHFTPMEMQLAMADMQTYFAFALMSYAMDRIHKLEMPMAVNGAIYINLDDLSSSSSDTTEYAALLNVKNYEPLHRVDFDNPLLMSSYIYSTTVNRLQYSDAIMRLRMKIEFRNGYNQNSIDTVFAAYRDLMGCDHNNLMAQICCYKNMQTQKGLKREDLELCLPYLTNPYVRKKAEQYIDEQFAPVDIATPLPNNNPATDFIHSYNAKYPGRFLVFDFWGMGCGPCRQNIESTKQLRAEIAKRTDVKLIFVAEEYTSEGSEPYKKYVSEWLADEETVCLPVAEFSRLKELFTFSGIPHHETITPDGRRVCEDLRFDRRYKIDDESMNKLKEKLK